jgi:hypothetical protein
MNRNFRSLLLANVFFAFSSVVFSQSGDVEARLSLAGGKTVYRMGESIRLVLSFTAARDGYKLEQTAAGVPLSLDDVILSPHSGVFDWAYEYRDGKRYYDDTSSPAKLSAVPTDLEFPLNNFVRFDKPGRYSVSVKTERVSTGNFGEKNYSHLSLQTNQVSFEVKPMSEAEELEEVKRLSALLDAKPNLREENRIAEELSYLGGEASTREKVRRFLIQQPFSINIALGLYTARNRALVIKLLENALRDTDRAATRELWSRLVHLRVLQEDANLRATTNSGAKESTHRDERFAEIGQSYLRELIESLPKRTGKNRVTTATEILLSLQRVNPPRDMFDKVREIILKEFDNLDILYREYLLGAYWEQLRDPLLLPSIERMLNDKGVPQMYSYNVRTTALKHLIELNQEKARPFVIDEIRNPNSFVNVEVLSSLDDEFLPETDDALLEQIRDSGQLKAGNRDFVLLRNKALLAARYATANIYEQLLETYKTNGDKWQGDARGSLIGYFARYNDREAVALLEQALATLGNGDPFSLFGDLTRMNYPPAFDDFFRKRLASDDLQTASGAAYLMSKYGGAANKELIEARLDRWLKEWSGRAAELDAQDAGDKIKYQAILQTSLIESLLNAKSWKLSEAEIRRLKQSCLTEACRRRFPIQ